MGDDIVKINLVLNESTVQAVEGRIKNLVTRLNKQQINLNINAKNLDNIINKLNTIEQQMQKLNNTSVNVNANLTQQQQQYRLITERLRVSQQLEITKQKTLQSENRAIAALAQQNRTLNVNNTTTHKIEQSTQNIKDNMGQVGGHTRDFVSYLANGVKYLLVYKSLYEVMNKIGESISEMKNVDSSLIQVRKTTGMSTSEIEDIRKQSYGVATEYGRNASEYLESVSEFARGGYKEQSTELGKISLLTQNVGDVSSDSANKMLLAVDAAYKLKGNVSELTEVVNGLNNVANLNPTSMQKLSDGLQVSASMAQTVGLELSDLVSLIGVGTSVTQREGAEISRAIRTILMNITQVKGELEDGTIIDDSSIAKAEKALNGVGIQTKEVVNGIRELRNPMVILDELSSKWDSLNSEAQSVLLESLGNKRQANVLSSILANWDMVEKIQSEYFNSANSAIKENELYLEGWEAKSAQVSAKWTEYISNIADTSLIKGTLDALYGAISVLDTPLGRVATQMILINTAFALTGKLWTAIKAKSIVAEIISIGVAEKRLGVALQLVTGHLLEQAKAWALTPMGKATIAISGILLLVSAVKKYETNLREAAKESVTAFNETTDELNKLNEELETTQERIKELQKLSDAGTISIADKAELEILKEQNKELSRQIALKQREQITEGKKVLKNAKEVSEKKVTSKYELVVQSQKEGTMTGAQVSVEKELQLAMDEYSRLKKELAKDDISKDQREIYQNDLSDAEARVDKMYNILATERQAYIDLDDAGYSLDKKSKERLKYLDEIDSNYLLWNHTLTQTKESFASLNAEQQRTILLSRLLEKDLNNIEADAVVNNIKDDDLEEYWDKDFSFEIPVRTDYASVEEYGKAYAEAWLKGVESKEEGQEKLSFLDTLNSTDNSKVKKELLDLAKSGEITPETLKTTEDYAELLVQTKTSAESATNQILDMLTAQEKLSGISQGLDKLKSAYEEFKDEDIGFVTAETLESLPDVFKKLPEFDLFSKIVGDPARVNEMQEAFDDLVSAYIRDQRLFTDIANASETEINSIIANLEQMGVTNAKEVVNTAKTEYEKATNLIKDAEKEYANYLDNKDGFNEEFINSTLSKNGQMINKLSDEYQTDYDNWCELLKKKSEALNEFINAIKSSGLYGDTDSVLSNYSTRTDEEAYKTAKKILDEYNQSKFNNSGLLGSFGNTDFSLRNDDLLNKDVIENARKTVAAYESAQKLSEKLSFNLSNVSVDFSSELDFEPPSDKDKKDKDPEDFDWIETKLNNTSDALDKVKDKVNDTYSTWESRNKSLQKAIADTQNAINLQAQAEATYLAKANSIALPEYLKDRVRLGDMSIQDNVDENTSKLINEYKEWYDKAKACKDAQDELNNSLNELKSTQFFELVNSEYDALYAKLDNSLDVLQSKIDKAELQGLFANESYYTSMIGYTQAKINNLEKERKQLQDVLNSSGVKNDTEAWNEMYQTLMDTDSEIRDLENQIIEFNNNIRDLDWEIFDYLEDSISRITDETEYLNSLIKESDLFDDKGNFTEYADASIGLHASAYDTHMQQAKDYYEEVQELQTQLLNGAGKDVLERYNDVAEAHRNSVLSAKNEQKAIIELVENSYQKQLDYLNEIIDKKKESLNAEKDLYDYQKSIEEKTSNIASLKKQEKAFLNDDSEYGMSQLQKIQLELSNAEKDLEQTEREQFLQDSQKMLDELYD